MTTDDRHPQRPVPDAAVDPREEAASLLTALALGELEGAERKRALAILAEESADSQRRHVEEARVLATLLRSGAPTGGASAGARAAVIEALGARQVATAARPTAVPAATARRRWPWLVAAGAVVASVVAAMVITRPTADPRQVALVTPAAPGESPVANTPPGGRLASDTKLGTSAATDRLGGSAPVDEKALASSVAGKASPTVADGAGKAGSPRAAAAADPAAAPAPGGKGLVFGFRGNAAPANRSTGAVADGEMAREARGESVVALEFEASPSPVAPGQPASAPASPAAAGLAGSAALVDRSAGDSLDLGAVPPVAAGSRGLLAAVPSRAADAKAIDERIVTPWRRSGEGLPGGGRGAGGERYARFVENPFQDPQTAPLSTFSIDVDTASYTIVRRFLAAGQRPPADAVRLEELVNYFRYADPVPPAGGDPFAVRLETAACPWNPEHRLVRVALKGREITAATRPAGNLVFLVDVAGSMRDPDKLPLVKQALLLLVDQLREEDRVSIVTYAGDAGLKLPATGGDRPEAIRGVIRALDAGGSTHGSAGIELAYEEAKRHFVPGGANRVILCTDGDLNVGITDDMALVKLIRAKAAEGTFLTVLGFGQGNLQDEKMEKLADNGNGLYAYVDSVREARKVLVEQLTGSTVTIAKDVKIQVEFNPAHVASYRLLGYENRVMAARDFADDTKDAGEIGAGHGVTALYEYVPAGADAGQPAELKYGPRQPVRPRPEAEGPASRELLTVKLRYKQPEGRDSLEREFPLVDAGGSFDSASDDLRFASAVAAFGMLLRDSAHAGDATLPRVAEIAGGAIGADPGGLRAEFLDLVRLAGGVQPPRE